MDQSLPQPLTAEDAEDAEGNKSFTAKDAGDAKEKRSLTAKIAKDAKETIIRTKPQGREDNAKSGIRIAT